MEKGDWNDELLILNKGSARTKGKVGDPGFTTFDAGAFWGELQFLALERRRTLSVYASTYCEIGSLSPANIKRLRYGEVITNRLKAYATMRQKLEVKLSAGEKVDMDAALEELQRGYREEEEAEFEKVVAPPAVALATPLGESKSEDSGQAVSESLRMALEDMQIAHRQTEAQVALLGQKTDAQLGQLLALVQDLSRQVAAVQETASATANAAANPVSASASEQPEDDRDK